ncbi:Uma2 family endonuclease [Actinorugispora endophytica]|nr:Uma2 family endonuclease [Actinorugispora endophytica]
METGPHSMEPDPEDVLRAWQELDVPDGWRAEIIDPGKISLMSPPSNPHNFIAELVQDAFHPAKPDKTGLYQTVGLWIAVTGRLFIPDLAVIPRSIVRESKAPLAAHEALIVVEITSRDNATDDRVKKLAGYAHGMVPLYLLVDAWDPTGPSVTLYEQPHNGRYDVHHTVSFGRAITVPAPFDIELDTSEFPPGSEWK